MIGDGDVLQLAFDCRFDHFDERCFAVGCVGMHVKVAAHVGQLEQWRNGVVSGLGFEERESRLPDLRRWQRKAQGAVHLLFGCAGDVFIIVGFEHAVLVDLEAHLFGASTQFYVVFFRARKVLQGSPECFGWDDAQIDLKSCGQSN